MVSRSQLKQNGPPPTVVPARGGRKTTCRDDMVVAELDEHALTGEHPLKAAAERARGDGLESEVAMSQLPHPAAVVLH
jgi:hypothetical protein